ncbi:MAG: type IV secretory system conjugative DNA transfer family protein [Hyphomicrobiaceae bacterium]
MRLIFACTKFLLYWLCWAMWKACQGAYRLTRQLLRKRSVTFGSARFSTIRELRRAGALDGDGLIIGKVGQQYLRFNNPEGSALVFAPSGAGKGVGFVIPNLLSYPGSMVITDPKGENYCVTRRQRSTFGKVVSINLIDPDSSDRFNPLDEIRIGTNHEQDDAEVLADLMLTHDPRADSHWRDKAKSWLTGILLYVAYARVTNPDWSTLGVVNKLVCAGRADLDQMVTHMAAFPVEKVREVAGEIARGLDSTEEAWNILSNMAKGTEAWGFGKPMGKIGRSSSFRLADLTKETVSVYLMVPEDKLAIYGGVLRVVVGMALNSVEREGKHHTPLHKPMFMLDEAAALGYLQPLESGMGHLRAYARCAMVFQDLHQLRATYPKAESMIANFGAVMGWAVNDMPTATMLSERIGATTVVSHSVGVSQSSAALLRHQSQAGLSEASRLLLDPAEITRLPADTVLAFIGRKVEFPIKAERVRYYEERCFKGMWDAWREGKASGMATVDLGWWPRLQAPASLSTVVLPSIRR